MNLRPTKVPVFGNPKVGTKLMQDKQGRAGSAVTRLRMAG